ncbi:MAG: Xaa-Pro dipeptidase [Thermoanaerobaculia bacterium]
MNDKLAELYPAHIEQMRRRFDRALGETGYDRAVIFAGAEHMIFLDDMPYSFKVNPHFKSWVPILTVPDSFVSYAPGEKPLLVFYQPVDYWYKPPEPPSGYWVGEFDIRVIANPEEAKELVVRPGTKTAFLGEPEPTVAAWNVGDPNPERLVNHLHFERAWKTDYELECMRQATVLGVRGHRAAAEAFRSGASEYEIHLAYLRATGHTEAELPYGNIIAFNQHASVLHYQYLERAKPSASERYSFLIDAGASVNGYACDITRTYSQRQDEYADLVAAMDTAQQEICNSIRPGTDYRDVHMLAHHKIGEILHRFGFTDLDGDGAVESRLTATFLPHGIGHLIGLQVHDVGGFSADPKGTPIPKPEGHPYLRLTRKVEPRMVFTIEPGLYFIDSLLKELRESDNAKHVKWEKVDSFRKYGGIRVEDDIAVTSDGIENMTRAEFARQEA